MTITSRERANAIRFLAIDSVQKANSGHPGMPMGMADIAEVLWTRFLKHSPKHPKWLDRDRFVLSNGHGAMLQYALLHLSGYDLSIQDLKDFRQLHSKTPGHPEVHETPGVETTTGPLGQGLANAVGMAIAEKMLAAHFNRPNHAIVDHHTYAFVGDGCLMEGISHEACSLAGTLGLGKLIVFWDDNEISIDGNVSGWFTNDVPKTFDSYGWQVIEAVDGHDAEQIAAAIEKAQAETDKPTIICCKTQIGFGSPNKVGKSSSHGSPLGDEEIALTRENLNWPYAPFEIPEEIQASWDMSEQGAELEKAWSENLTAYEAEHPELAAELVRRLSGQLPSNWSQLISDFIEKAQEEQKPTATRKASGAVLQAIAPELPELIGGSADLSGSNNTLWKGASFLTKDNADASYINYGVREFAMAAIMNGMALHGGFIPYAGTFLVFQSYAANATRMSALMGCKVVYVFTHDSIGLGEDGPTHQPVMETATLRMTPGMTVWRPADLVETAIAWENAIEADGPASLLLTRQTIEAFDRDEATLENARRGAYVLQDCAEQADVILIATGSELELAMQASDELRERGLQVRVVSMPSCEVFEAQDDEYKKSVLPAAVTNRVAVEASAADFWYKYVGLQGKVIGMNRFGLSAPYKQAYEECGITVDAIVQAASALVSV
jgi:transketolase